MQVEQGSVIDAGYLADDEWEEHIGLARLVKWEGF